MYLILLGKWILVVVVDFGPYVHGEKFVHDLLAELPASITEVVWTNKMVDTTLRCKDCNNSLCTRSPEQVLVPQVLAAIEHAKIRLARQAFALNIGQRRYLREHSGSVGYNEPAETRGISIVAGKNYNITRGSLIDLSWPSMAEKSTSSRHAKSCLSQLNN